MSSNKILFVCSDTAAFTYDSKYRLKDKYRVYSSDECRDLKEDDKKNKISGCNLIIIDVINDKNDLKLLNLPEFKKIAVLRNHESRNVGWTMNSYLKCDVVCKFNNQHLLTDFKDAETLIKNLQAVEIDVEGDWKFYLKKGLRWFLFCLNQSS